MRMTSGGVKLAKIHKIKRLRLLCGQLWGIFFSTTHTAGTRRGNQPASHVDQVSTQRGLQPALPFLDEASYHVPKELTMSRICVAALVLALSVTSVSFAVEPYPSSGYGDPNDYIAAATPSGLRFGGADLSVRTGSIQDPAGYAGCSSCSGFGCLDWKYNTWYGSWDGQHGYGHGDYRNCGNGWGY
jgi:hypothetical protein